MRIGLVTTQFPGLTHAGGISPPLERLARAAAERCGECTVLLARTGKPVSDALKQKYKRSNIRLVDLDGAESATYPWWLESQLTVRRALEPLHLDHVIVQDWQGLGALLTVGPPVAGSVTSWLHGGQMYTAFGSGRYFSRFPEFIDAELERHQLETSARIVSPSRFLIDWYGRQGWTLDKSHATVIPYLMEDPAPHELAAHDVSERTVVAFVGSLTHRKGVDRLLQVLKENEHRSGEVQVRIFGVPLEYSARQTRNSLRKLGFDVHVETKWSTHQIWQSLANSRTLVVCPSRLDNSPNIVYEAATRGHHSFVWPNNGASELVDIFPGLVHTWNDLDSALEIVHNQPPRVPDVKSLNDSITDQWFKLLSTEPRSSNGSASSESSVRVHQSEANSDKPIVSVVIASKNRMNHLREAIRSLILQDIDRKFEVVIIDDVSDEPYALDQLPSTPPHIEVRIDRNTAHLGQGASRNRGAQLARSDVLIFADDDNLLRSHHLSMLLGEWRRSKSSAVVASLSTHLTDGVLTIQSNPEPAFEAVFVGDHFLPLGYMINTVGDTNFLVEREAFEAVGGWSEEWPTAIEDWEILLRIVHAGHRVGATCTPTVDYRKNSTGVYAQLFDGLELRRIDTSVAAAATPEYRNLLMLSRAAYTTGSILTPGLVLEFIRKGFLRFRREPVRTSMMALRLASRTIRKILAQRTL